ncbi:hypothetical protein K431DRAFT_288041 [Polychaeton citri CBS 116435]|uniref:Uncharacterized protein n=1 Tax=Polychaeton citri CBS 116435 TaxID=1314669 RepID=A0A9P4PZW6_9PEZI|nr:hypothetical protein K431DRAFT_288041 [Polychaeton citri CBS 116435]
MRKLESSEFLHFHPADHGGKDLSKDRYIFELHAAERRLASEVNLNCTEYLLTKRKFLRDFGTECIRHKQKLHPSSLRSSVPASSNEENAELEERKKSGGRPRGGRREKVRTEVAHIRWLENAMNWRNTRAKNLVVGWKLLRLLDESKFLP